jgi:hypothetical protein
VVRDQTGGRDDVTAQIESLVGRIVAPALGGGIADSNRPPLRVDGFSALRFCERGSPAFRYFLVGALDKSELLCPGIPVDLGEKCIVKI